jgi:peptide/nickel transport system ATP-binding protein
MAGVLRTEGLRLHHRGEHGIDIVLNAGGRAALWGAAGSGKSALLHTLARLERPASGRLYWGTEELSRKPRWLLRKRHKRIRLLWKNPYALFEEGLDIEALLNDRAEHRRGKQVLLQANNLSPAIQAFDVTSISGSQRVRLALAYLESPEILLVDDLFTHLTPETWDDLLALMDRALDQYGALLIATQFRAVLSGAKTIYVMLDGDIVEWGPRRVILNQPQHPYTRWMADRPATSRVDADEWTQTGGRQLPAGERKSSLKEVSPGHWVRVA